MTQFHQQFQEKIHKKERSMHVHINFLDPKMDSSISNTKNVWKKGTKVEISSKEEGYTGVLFEAKIMEPPDNLKHPNKALVQYQTLVTEQGNSPLMEYIHESLLRPVPPPFSIRRDSFELYDVVDAFYLDGWWTNGTVVNVFPDLAKCTVVFENPPDKLDLDFAVIRPHLDWIDGEWILPGHQEERSLNRLIELGQTSRCSQVISYDAAISCPSRRSRKRDNTTEEEKETMLQDIADSVKRKRRLPKLHIKCSPPSAAASHKTAKKTQNSECGNAYPMPIKECGTIKQTKGKGSGRSRKLFEKANCNLIGNVAGVSETDCGRENMEMAITETCDDTMACQPLHISSGGFSFGETDDVRAEASESQVMIPLIEYIENGVSCMNEKLPFKKSSPIWQMIDSMEVFKTMNQNPHFSPLSNSKEECREGLAIGSMVTFANLVEKTCKMQIDDPRSVWISYLEAFLDLEKHGFDVRAPRYRLLELLAIKDRHIANQGELIASVMKLVEDVSQSSKIDQEIERLNERIKELQEKRALFMSVKQITESGIVTLEQRIDRVHADIRSNLFNFERTLDIPMHNMKRGSLL